MKPKQTNKKPMLIKSYRQGDDSGDKASLHGEA